MNSDQAKPNPSVNRSVLKPWLRLLRISALPTAISNILMAYLLVQQSWTPTIELVLLVLASSSLYLAGMVLNDVFDYSIDLQQRPGRPLPAGQIAIATARYTGFSLLAAGVVLACIAGWIASTGSGLAPDATLFRTGLIAILLAIMIVLYDGPLKRTLAAPFLMGGCRTLNVLLGASTFIPLATGLGVSAEDSFMLGLPRVIWWVAVSIGVLITGTTLLGRKEAASTHHRLPLAIGGLLIVVGLAGLALVVYCPTTFAISAQTQRVFPLFIGIISLTVLRRVVEAVVAPKPNTIQAGVVSVLRSLIILDAALCYVVAPQHLGYGLAVLSLLVPSILLSRIVSST